MEITIKLPQEAWNAVLGVLAQRPFAEVSGLITEIQRQAQGQITPAAEDTAE